MSGDHQHRYAEFPMQFENVDDVESRERDSLQHDELQVLRELRPVDHSDDCLRGVRSVTSDAVDEHAVEPASGKDCSDDGNIASMRSRKWGVIESGNMRQSFGAHECYASASPTLRLI